MGRYENVFFAQEHEAVHLVDAIHNNGPEGVLDELTKHHHGGEHYVFDKEPWGKNDQTFQRGGYILSWNTSLPSVGLAYELEHRLTFEM